MGIKKYTILIVSLILFCCRAHGQKVFSAKSDQERTRISADYIQIFTDTSNTLTFEDVSSSGFNKFYSGTKRTEILGHGTNHWLKFQVTNTSAKSGVWILEFQDIAFIDVFIVNAEGNIEKLKSGVMVPQSQKQIKAGIRETISFNLNAQETKTFFVKLKLQYDALSLNFISIQDRSRYYDQQVPNDNFKQGIFHGLLWLMLLYNLFLYISTRKKSYLYYVGYVFFLSFSMLDAFRYLRNFFYSEYPQVTNYIGFAFLAAFIFYYLLLREFVESKKMHPKLDKVLITIVIVDLVLAAVICITQFISLNTGFLFGSVSTILNMIALLVLITHVFRLGDKVSQIFALGSLSLVAGTLIIMVGIIFGKNPEDLINFFQGGVIGEVFIFSLGLSYKYKINEQQKLKAQESLILQLKENQELQTKINRELEQKVQERTAEIKAQKEQLQVSFQEIQDSINYAGRIQEALLPSKTIFTENVPEHFILYKPKDIVSGDFYFIKKIKNQLIIAAADCTGHGVPGSLVSMLGIAFLNEITIKMEFKSAAEILEQLRIQVKTALKQTGDIDESKDGMDIALCLINTGTNLLQYAGAYNALYIIRDKKLLETKATRNPIGIHTNEKPFVNNEIPLKPRDKVYMFSDGFADQFGGKDGTKYLSKNFKNLLLEVAEKPMEEQKKALNTTIENWKNGFEQTDDILVIGFEPYFAS